MNTKEKMMLARCLLVVFVVRFFGFKTPQGINMTAERLPRILTALIAAALWTFVSPAAAFNNIDLEFTELPGDAGVTFTEYVDGIPVTGFTVSGETVSLVDGTFGNSFSTGSGTPHLFNLMEPDGVTISDQVQVFSCSRATCGPSFGTRVMFTSEPGLFDLGEADFTTIEDGTRQFVGGYTNNRGNPMSVFVTSVPEPTSLALLGLGLAGLGFARRKVGK